MANKPPNICVRGARHNNLKGIDLELSPGNLIVFTGLSGAGKSTLLFDVLHAEGQRKYVETFSPYVRQFLETCPRPEVDSIENIRPSIAVEQKNTIRNSRSTVGTMTEICDYFKVWFPQVANLVDPASGETVRFETPDLQAEAIISGFKGQSVVIGFLAQRPLDLQPVEFLRFLSEGGHVRSLEKKVFNRIEDLMNAGWEGDSIFVVTDRLIAKNSTKSRIIEAVTTAIRDGHGLAQARDLRGNLIKKLHEGLRSPVDGREFTSPSASAFSFNSSVGACPKCKGFGRVIEIDPKLVIPDSNLSLGKGAIKAFSGKVYGHCQRELEDACLSNGISLTKPWKELKAVECDFIWNGDDNYVEGNGKWYGIRVFFNWLQKKTYKMHVRVYLSRYRGYFECPDCKGSRLKETSLFWKWKSFTLPDLYKLPIDDLLSKISQIPLSADPKNDLPIENIKSRLGYLQDVGLGYLTLDRSARSLSGGETQRVNLTACLGSSLTDTLFALDEPTIGLHGQDIDKLIGVLRALSDAGNCVCVVEHDEKVIRSADKVIEIGPRPGANGGSISFNGTVSQLLRSKKSLTGKWLSQDAQSKPRKIASRTRISSKTFLRLKDLSCHNIRKLSAKIPLNQFVCLAGVSGSGKSTLMEDLIYSKMSSGQKEKGIDSDQSFSETVMIDQSSVVRTPRSNPVLYSDAWGPIKEAFGRTDETKRLGFSASDFSFNAGNGRCEECSGLGYEIVEMQFLSDLQIPCNHCGGKRFKSEILEIKLDGLSVFEVLGLTVDEAAKIYQHLPKTKRKLEALGQVGLGYLTLGQPLNTLSGGESQRLKLVKYLTTLRKGSLPSLLLIDEPTTGLHMDDVDKLLACLREVVHAGHSLLVIEHNRQVLQEADWIIELGPGAGKKGGQIIAEGSPASLMRRSTPTSKIMKLANPREEAPERSGGKGRGARKREDLKIIGARENNLKNLSVDIPANKFVVVTGPSGSGKSSLAFDVIFAEGQRRFMESMSSYARQFVNQLSKPEVDSLSGISPTVAIEQRVTRGSRKSTVGSTTEIAQFLRLLYSRAGTQLSTLDQARLTSNTEAEVTAGIQADFIINQPSSRKPSIFLAPLISNRKGHHKPIVNWAREKGYAEVRCDGKIIKVDEFEGLDRYREHNIEVVIERWTSVPSKAYLAQVVRTALDLGKGRCLVLPKSGEENWHSTSRVDPATGKTYPEIEPALLSWNSPKGWCPFCRGYGKIYEKHKDHLPANGIWWKLKDGDTCPECKGERLNQTSRNIVLYGSQGTRFSLPEALRLSPSGISTFLKNLKVEKNQKPIVEAILPGILERLGFMEKVGLDYLSLDRETSSLSGGEAQRIRLASQLGSNLSGVLYVLDEPSIGLHPVDNERLIESLRELQTRGNSLVVVEHDLETIMQADYLIDIGPGAGRNGGEIVGMGSPSKIMKNPNSPTGAHLKKGFDHPTRGHWRKIPPESKAGWLKLSGVNFRNLIDLSVGFPTKRLTVCCGVSGSGKSSLVRGVLLRGVKESIAKDKRIHKGQDFRLTNGNIFHRAIEVTQAPIGKTPRSTPATYLGVWDRIRSMISSLPEAKAKGLCPSDFSFNVKGGRCEICKGAGKIKMEMSFLPNSYVPCDDCGGKRYREEILKLKWKDKSIADILDLTFEEASVFFKFDHFLESTFSIMVETGLGYMKLGQPSPTLSGGEAQRLKLAAELASGIDKGKHGYRAVKKPSLYVLEEPTIGLHPTDTQRLIHLLHRLVEENNTVVVIEHDIEVIAEGDYIIELGPMGGEKGGEILHCGTVLEALSNKKCRTAPFLKSVVTKPKNE
jgi:excinuclease ABC subunit A